MTTENRSSSSRTPNMEMLDPLLEAMIEGVIAGTGRGNVSVEFNFLPFVVGEEDSDEGWGPEAGPGIGMEIEFTPSYRDNFDDEKEDDEQEEEEHDDEEEEEDSANYMGSEDDDNNRDYNDELDDNEEDNEYDYSSQYDEDDGYNDYTDNAVIDNYGTFGWLIYRNLSKSKIYDVNSGLPFVRQMIEYFLMHLRQEGNKQSADSLLKLLCCLPPLQDLKNVIQKTKYTLKEAIIIKIVLEIYENYYRRFDSPTFTIFQEEVLPLILDFYNRLADSAHKLVNNQLKKILSNIKDYGNEFQLFNTKTEYVDYYRDVVRHLRNLCGNTQASLYLR